MSRTDRILVAAVAVMVLVFVCSGVGLLAAHMNQTANPGQPFAAAPTDTLSPTVTPEPTESPTPVPTDTPTPQIKLIWRGSGYGFLRTPPFVAKGFWELNWQCDPSGGTYNVIVEAYPTSDSGETGPGELIANTICEPGGTTGGATETNYGAYFVQVSILGPWSVTIIGDQ